MDLEDFVLNKDTKRQTQKGLNNVWDLEELTSQKECDSDGQR